MNAPIKTAFLIGSHRSGTTWTGGLLGSIPGFAYWEEPRHVWSFRNWNKPDDCLSADDARPEVAAHITRRFFEFAKKRNAHTFCEKTPSCCLRIPFINRIFPEGKFVVLLRDARAVLRSTSEIQETGAGWDRIFGRICETQMAELPAFTEKLPWIWRRLIGKRLDYWGVRPPGWESWPGTLSPNQVIARQWADSISLMWSDLQQISPDRRLIVRYEELVLNSQMVIDQMAEFLETDPEPLLASCLKSRRPDTVEYWKNELSAEFLSEVRGILEPAMNKIGYQW